MPAASQPAKQNVDSFANLVSFGGKKESLSLKEQQEKIEKERQAKEEERRKKEESFWDGLGRNPGSSTNPFTSPAPVSREPTIRAPSAAGQLESLRPAQSKNQIFGADPPYISAARNKKTTLSPNSLEEDDNDVFFGGQPSRSSKPPTPASPLQSIDDDDLLFGDQKTNVNTARRENATPSPRPIENDNGVFDEPPARQSSSKPPTPRPADDLRTGRSSRAGEVDPEKVANLEQMGFSPAHARRALRETDGDMERAVDWLFSHQGESGESEPRRRPRPEANGSRPQTEDSEVPKWMRQPTKEEKLWKGFKGMTEKGLKGMSEKLFGESSSRSSSAKPPLVPERPGPAENSERSSRSSSARPPAMPSRPRRFVEEDELPVYTSAARRKKATPSPRPIESSDAPSSSASSKPPTPAPRPKPVEEVDLLFGEQPSIPSSKPASNSAALLMGEEPADLSSSPWSNREAVKPTEPKPQSTTPVARRRSEDDADAPTWGRAAAPRPAAKPKVATPKPRLRPGQEPDAVVRMREANKEAERADDEKFALSDSVDARIAAWRDGKRDNLRALIVALDTVLWEGSGWKKVGLHELVINSKVKINYMKAITKTHPDKLPRDASIEVKMISAAVFATLNEAWDKFKADNGM